VNSFVVPGKHSKFIRIRNREQLIPAHCNELVSKGNQNDVLGQFQFFSSSSTYANWGFDELIQLHWCNWEKSHSRYEKGISRWLRKIPGYCPVSFIWKSGDDFQEAKLNVIDWPGNSLDLNPVENLWSVRKSRLQKFDCTTLTKPIEAIIQVWHPGLRSQR